MQERFKKNSAKYAGEVPKYLEHLAVCACVFVSLSVCASLGVSLCVRLCVCVIIKSRLSNFGRKMARCECLPSSSCRCCSLSTSSLNSFCFCCFIFFAHLACFSFRFFFLPLREPSAYPLFRFVTPSSILSQLARFFAFICAQSPRPLLCLSSIYVRNFYLKCHQRTPNRHVLAAA